MDSEKSVDACFFAPNERPILRILGMNNRNKITFKMFHLTVDAWRLRRLHSFQRARWLHTGGPWFGRRDTIPPHKTGLVFCTGTCCPEVVTRREALGLDELQLCLRRIKGICVSIFLLEPESELVSQSQVNRFHSRVLFAVLRAQPLTVCRCPGNVAGTVSEYKEAFERE